MINKLCRWYGVIKHLTNNNPLLEPIGAFHFFFIFRYTTTAFSLIDLINSVTKSVEQNPNWEATICSSGHHILFLLWNRNILYHVSGCYPEPSESRAGLQLLFLFCEIRRYPVKNVLWIPHLSFVCTLVIIKVSNFIKKYEMVSARSMHGGKFETHTHCLSENIVTCMDVTNKTRFGLAIGFTGHTCTIARNHNKSSAEPFFLDIPFALIFLHWTEPRIEMGLMLYDVWRNRQKNLSFPYPRECLLIIYTPIHGIVNP
jgi:hypothetical protein